MIENLKNAWGFMSMNNNENEEEFAGWGSWNMFKGFALSIFIITLMLVGPAYYFAFASDDYARQCKMSIAIPCIGVDE